MEQSVKFFRLSSKSIIAAVLSSLHLARPFPLTRGHCAVLVDYILDELQRDYSTMSRMTKFLDNLVKIHGKFIVLNGLLKEISNFFKKGIALQLHNLRVCFLELYFICLCYSFASAFNGC